MGGKLGRKNLREVVHSVSLSQAVNSIPLMNSTFFPPIFFRIAFENIFSSRESAGGRSFQIKWIDRLRNIEEHRRATFERTKFGNLFRVIEALNLKIIITIIIICLSLTLELSTIRAYNFNF